MRNSPTIVSNLFYDNNLETGLTQIRYPCSCWCSFFVTIIVVKQCTFNRWQVGLSLLDIDQGKNNNKRREGRREHELSILHNQYYPTIVCSRQEVIYLSVFVEYF